IKASLISLGKLKSGPRTSTSVISAPNDRKALATPAPVASETCRSDPGPPLRTAIFFPCRLIIVSRSFSHDLHFGLQFDPASFPRRLLDHANELEHFGSAGLTFVHNEITVHVRDTRIPHSQTF